jgi:hypothetical protein
VITPKQDEFAVRIDQLIEPIIEERIKEGFVPPLRSAAIFANGSIVAFQFSVGGESAVKGAVLAEYLEPRRATIYPINVMIVDAMGEGIHVMIGPDGAWRGGVN